MRWIDDITDFIFLEDAPTAADVIFIPGNGHSEPSEYAAELYKQGLSPFILPSGRHSILLERFTGQTSGRIQYAGTFETEWDFMHAVLLAQGVPDNAILREDHATYTYENAIYSRHVADAHGLTIRRALLVCMPYHARRAGMYYETLFPDAELFICPVPDTTITRDNWFTTADGIERILGEVERCGTQFHAILKEIEGLA